MVPLVNTKHGICRFIRPGILLLLLVLPVNAGTRLEGKNGNTSGIRLEQVEEGEKDGKKPIREPVRKTKQEPVTNHQISPWNMIQVF
ncbi:MAG: hypothetical protein U0T82_16080 [Bacteroidales bacterium]